MMNKLTKNSDVREKGLYVVILQTLKEILQTHGRKRRNLKWPYTTLKIMHLRIWAIWGNFLTRAKKPFWYKFGISHIKINHHDNDQDCVFNENPEENVHFQKLA